jgi:hypothetical protein
MVRMRGHFPFVMDDLEGLTSDPHYWHWGRTLAVVREVVPGRYAAIVPMANEWMLFTGRTATGGEFYDNRWIFKNATAAMAGLMEWGGEGDPPGWSDHPKTKRLNPDPLVHVSAPT